MDDNQIKGIITESKSGRTAILADCVVDCTGDADVAHLAGAEYSVLPQGCPTYLLPFDVSVELAGAAGQFSLCVWWWWCGGGSTLNIPILPGLRENGTKASRWG